MNLRDLMDQISQSPLSSLIAVRVGDLFCLCHEISGGFALRPLTQHFLLVLSAHQPHFIIYTSKWKTSYLTPFIMAALETSDYADLLKMLSSTQGRVKIALFIPIYYIWISSKFQYTFFEL